MVRNRAMLLVVGLLVVGFRTAWAQSHAIGFRQPDSAAGANSEFAQAGNIQEYPGTEYATEIPYTLSGLSSPSWSSSSFGSPLGSFSRSYQRFEPDPFRSFSNVRLAPARTRTQASYYNSPPSAPPEDHLKDSRIVCIFNNKQFYRLGFKPSMIDPLICTHVNYEFAILDPRTYEMIPGEPDIDIQMDLFDEAVNLKKKNPKLKVLLSLGGWEDSTKKYSELVASDDKIENFIEKGVKFLKSHEFDGLDVAWEYPNCWQGALGVSPKDKDNFSGFLAKLREAFDEENLTLSISAGAIKREIVAAYDGPAVSKSVDFINVMVYDMHGPWESTTGHHSQYDKMPDDDDPYCNMKGAIETWIEIGVDRKKINVGIPTYAKTFTLAHSSTHGLGAKANGPGKPGPATQQSGLLCYNEICQFLNAGNWTEDEDKDAGFYAYSGDSWACYDPPMMVVRKAKWLVESGLGGVLIKDISCDDYEGKCFNMPFPLIKMTRMEMIQSLKKLG